MPENQALSGQAKKLLVLVFVGVVLLAAIAGLFWPDPTSETAVVDPTDDGTTTEADSQDTSEPEADPDGEEADRQTLAASNDELLTETYGLELPATIRGRELILEAHQLLVDFERVKEELNEFADSTRYSCQQFRDAINPLGSGPGAELSGIFTRLLESDIGLEIIETVADPADNEIVSVGDLSDLELDEITAVAGLVQDLNDVNNDFAATEARLAECGLDSDILEIGTGGDNNLGRKSDISTLIAALNTHRANQNNSPAASRADIEASLAGLIGHYSPEQINAAGSWDGAALPADGDFSWHDGYENSPAPESYLGLAGSYDHIVVINGAQCDDQEQLPVRGAARQTAVVYRLEEYSRTFCRNV